MAISNFNFVILMGFFLFLGCSKSTSPSSGPASNPILVADEVSKKVSDNAIMPDLNDTRTFEFLEFHDMSNETCIYTTSQKTTVSNISEGKIELTYDRSFVYDSENIQGCPAQHPDFVAHESLSWNIEDYKQMKIESIKQNLDPAEYLKNDWVQSARIISSREIDYNGLHTQMVEMEVITKKGINYSYKQYVSLDSLFLGVFEYLRQRADNGFVANYQVMKGYSVKKLAAR